MGINDMMRSIFGLPPRDNKPSNPGDHFESWPQNPPSYFGGSLGDPRARYNEDDTDQEHFGRPGEPFPFHQPSDMFRHFDEMFRSFDEVFRSMGMADFPRMEPGMPAIEAPPSNEEGSLRDKMLKPSQPKRESPWAQQPGVSPFFNHGYTDTRSKEDKDLDEEVKKGDLDKIFTRPKQPTQEIQPFMPQEPKTFFKSYSYSSVRGGDGRVEEKRTVYDGSGNEEVTITRRLGDQEHSVTTKKKSSGEEEHIELFNNMDERDKEKFENRWQSPQQESSQRDQLIKQPSLDTDTRSLFQKLFGS